MQTKVDIPVIVGVLKGAVVALRLDSDALPVLERTAVSFASKVKRSLTEKKML
jgi:metal-dependent amidase/aminoacylase/carboxypeptidase family protein